MTIEEAILRLEKYDPDRARTEIINLFSAAQCNLDFAVIVEDVLGALRSWERLLSR